MCRLSWNLGASTSWNPQGLFRPVMGLLYLLHSHIGSCLMLCSSSPWLSRFAETASFFWHNQWTGISRGCWRSHKYKCTACRWQCFLFPGWMAFRASQLSHWWVHCVFCMHSAKDVSSLNFYKGIIEATSDYFPSLYSNWARNNQFVLQVEDAVLVVYDAVSLGTYLYCHF